MEPLNISFIADTTIRGGNFQTPMIQSLTHCQRDNSRLFHTREDDGLPFHYCSRTVGSDKFMGCIPRDGIVDEIPCDPSYLYFKPKTP